MATEQEDDITFEEIDWETVDRDVSDLSVRRLIEFVTFGVWVLALLYDAFLIPNDRATIPGVWDVTSVEWLFILTLVLGFYHVVLPLADNPRMTLYYWREFKKNKPAVASLGFLIVIFVTGIVGPIVMEPPQLDLMAAYQPPVGITATVQGETVTGTWAHPLGTDHQGQDMFKLVVYGMRVSMEVGLISMVIAVTIGTIVGTTAAHFGGYVDEALMRYVDLQQTFPGFILLLLLVYLFGGSLFLIIVLYGFLSWEGTARLIRSEALQRTEEAYIRAAETAGASRWWIIRRHLIPNVSSTVITIATLSIPGFILGEASLSFLGLGDPNVYSWGKVIAGGRSSLASAPWIATIPGIFLFLTVLAFNFLGDALRDAIDPRQET
ncbi:MAG: ABC transporter permease [Halobacteriales archaeon]|nr:ABC transporter permease [Halobacteriales archaeon]